MNYLLEVCLVAVTLGTSIAPPLVAQSEAHARPPLQKGISVELPVTSNAVPEPDADGEDASIVTVTDDGRVYLGIALTTPAALAETVKSDLSNRREKKLYIKADDRTSYANVMQVLDTLRTAGVEDPNLLTTQTVSSAPGTLVSPNGLGVSLGPQLSASPDAIVLQVLKSRQQEPTLKINDERIPRATLKSTLWQLFKNRNEKVVLVKADGTLPFADVVAVIDVCQSTGAKVVLVTPGQ
jgi:biopolymer transport protein ExbD